MLLEYCSKVFAIAPRMVLFDLNFPFLQSRWYTINVFATNTCQRLQTFLDFNTLQQESVQNSLIYVQFKSIY